MAIFTVRHLTTYRYGREVAFGEHRMMLRPHDRQGQRLVNAKFTISPRPAAVRWINDVFGNTVALARFESRAARLRFDNSVRIDHAELDALDFRIDEEALVYPFPYAADERFDLAPWIALDEADDGRELRRWVAQFLHRGGRTETGHLLMTLTNAIKESFAYVRRVSPGTQRPTETLALRRGTCRDFATLMIAAVRSLGLAARFVSGYLYVQSRDQEAGHRGGGSTHAWCQVYLPGAGWTDFDPTNGIVGNRDLIGVAVAREPRQAVPISGSFVGSMDDFVGLDVEVIVRRGDSEEVSAEPIDEDSVAGDRA